MSFDVAHDLFAAYCDRCDELATGGLPDGTHLCDDCHAETLDRGVTDE